jgi:hypothetical protein
MRSLAGWLGVLALGVVGCRAGASHVALAHPAGPDVHARAAAGATQLGCWSRSQQTVTTVYCGDDTIVFYDQLRTDGRWGVGAHCTIGADECREIAERILDAGAAPTAIGGGPR